MTDPPPPLRWDDEPGRPDCCAPPSPPAAAAAAAAPCAAFWVASWDWMARVTLEGVCAGPDRPSGMTESRR